MGDSSRCFTPDEANSVGERYVAGESIEQLAAAFACSSKMIRNILERSGIERRPQVRKRLFSNEVEAEICRRYVDGESSDVLARAFGTNGRTILNVITRGGVEKRLSASASNPIVTDEQRRTIVDLCSGNAHTYDQAAQIVGVSRETVRRVLREAGVSLYVGTKRTCEINDHAFDVLTPEALYWIGFLFADGHISNKDRGSPVLVVGLSAIDRGHLEKLRTFLGSTHKISDRPLHDSKPTFKGGPMVKTGPSVYFRARSKHIFKTLTARGIVTKSARVPPPELAESRDFWRGALDGDGSIGINSQQQRYSYPSVTLAGQRLLLDKFSAFLAMNGLSGLKPYWGDGVWSVGTTGSTVKDIVRLLYDDATVVLERKARRVVCILNDCQKLSSENGDCSNCVH